MEMARRIPGKKLIALRVGQPIRREIWGIGLGSPARGPQDPAVDDCQIERAIQIATPKSANCSTLKWAANRWHPVW